LELGKRAIISTDYVVRGAVLQNKCGVFDAFLYNIFYFPNAGHAEKAFSSLVVVVVYLKSRKSVLISDVSP